MTATTLRRVDLSTKLYYGFGAVASGAKSNGFNYLLLFFYSQVVGLDARLVSIGILIALLVDAVSDPLVGHISDNLHSRWGRRHPFMYFSGVPVAVAYYFMWSPPDLTQNGLFVYFICMAIIIRTMITFYEVPSIALVAELTDDYDQRTEMTSFRYFFGWWGGLSMAVANYLFFLPEEKGGLEYVAGWSNYGLMAAIVIFLSIYVSAIGLHKHIPKLRKPPAKHAFNFKRTANEVIATLSTRSFFALFVAALLIAVGNGVSTTLSIYFYRHFWEFTTTQIGYINLPYFLAAAMALFLAPLISRKIGKKAGGIIIMLVAFLSAPMPYILRIMGLMPENGTPELFWSLMVFNTIEVTLIVMWSALLAAMIADIVEDSEVRTGRRSEGIFFAANTFAQKAVNGLGVVVAGMILTYIHFPEQAKPGEVPQETIFSLATLYVPVLLFFYLLAVAVLSLYKISRADHSANLERLAAESA